MRKLFFIFFTCFFLTGCENLSPRDNFSPKLQQDINNQQGRIDKIENNQNAIRTEIEKLSLINNENHNNGVQILQGDGALILIFGIATVFIIVYYYYKKSESDKKAAEILADQIAKFKNKELDENILKAAQYTNVEERVYKLMKKKKT